jgi:uncharacterized MnhB-related membrane protein
MWHILLTIGILISAIQAIRTKRLLVTALWLASTSALTSILLYLLGGYRIAVIELSVGAGLVTVLFVFAINIAGEEPIPTLTIIPKPLASIFIFIAVGIIFWQLIPLSAFQVELNSINGVGFLQAIWLDRQIDLYLQIVFIFAGVLSMVSLLSEKKLKRIKLPEDAV